MYSYGPPHMAVQKQDDQHEHTFSNYVRIQDVVQKTCLRRWTIGKSGERGSGISVLPAQHDDDDDDDSYLRGDEMDSCFSQGHYCKVKHIQTHSRFELGLSIPFPMMTVTLSAPQRFPKRLSQKLSPIIYH